MSDSPTHEAARVDAVATGEGVTIGVSIQDHMPDTEPSPGKCVRVTVWFDLSISGNVRDQDAEQHDETYAFAMSNTAATEAEARRNLAARVADYITTGRLGEASAATLTVPIDMSLQLPLDMPLQTRTRP